MSTIFVLLKVSKSHQLSSFRNFQQFSMEKWKILNFFRVFFCFKFIKRRDRFFVCTHSSAIVFWLSETHNSNRIKEKKKVFFFRQNILWVGVSVLVRLCKARNNKTLRPKTRRKETHERWKKKKKKLQQQAKRVCRISAFLCSRWNYIRALNSIKWLFCFFLFLFTKHITRNCYVTMKQNFLMGSKKPKATFTISCS